MKIDLQHLQSWIGREQSGRDILTPALVSQFGATLNRVCETANGDRAPDMIHWCLAQPTVPTSELGQDGHPALGQFLPPVPLPRRMWAGGELAFHDSLYIGDEIKRRSVISDVQVKDGKSGTLCFVTVSHTISVSDRLICTERQDIVYRDAPNGAAATIKPVPAETGEHTRLISAHPTLLFRYSALTFNGHRIHYDRRFCKNTEGYPGLVIHGPLQATMLFYYAAELKGASPRTFRFRSLSPLFDDADFSLNGKFDGNLIELWTAARGGPVAMRATAAW